MGGFRAKGPPEWASQPCRLASVEVIVCFQLCEACFHLMNAWCMLYGLFACAKAAGYVALVYMHHVAGAAVPACR